MSDKVSEWRKNCYTEVSTPREHRRVASGLASAPDARGQPVSNQDLRQKLITCFARVHNLNIFEVRLETRCQTRMSGANTHEEYTAELSRYVGADHVHHDFIIHASAACLDAALLHLAIQLDKRITESRDALGEIKEFVK